MHRLTSLLTLLVQVDSLKVLSHFFTSDFLQTSLKHILLSGFSKMLLINKYHLWMHFNALQREWHHCIWYVYGSWGDSSEKLLVEVMLSIIFILQWNIFWCNSWVITGIPDIEWGESHWNWSARTLNYHIIFFQSWFIPEYVTGMNLNVINCMPSLRVAVQPV